MILGGPKDTIPSLWTKGLKALVPSNSFGPPTMVAVVVDFKDRAKSPFWSLSTMTKRRAISPMFDKISRCRYLWDKHCQRHNGPRNWLRNMDQTWQQHGITNISCKFGHQMAPLALVANMATRWRHLHYLQIWPPDGVTCKYGHQMAPLTLIANLATRWRHLQ